MNEIRIGTAARATWWILFVTAVVGAGVALVKGLPAKDDRYVFFNWAVAGFISAFFLILLRWFFYERTRLAALIILITVPTAVILFYGEEDWRGKAHWQQVQRKCAKEGDDFSWNSVVPPPVAPEDNFAMAPVIVPTYSYLLDSEGHPKDLHGQSIHASMFDELFAGEMPTEAPASWALGTRLNLVAWQRYLRSPPEATFFFPSLPPELPAAEDILLALDKYHDTLEQLREAVKRPESRFPLEYSAGIPFNISLSHHIALHRISILLELRSIAELKAGQSSQALADVHLSLKLLEVTHSEPFAFSQWQRATLLNRSLQSIWEGLADHRWTADELVALDTDLAGLDFIADYRQAVRGDTASQIKVMQYFMRHPKELNSFLNEGYFVGDAKLKALTLLHWANWAPAGWYYEYSAQLAEIVHHDFMPVAQPESQIISVAQWNKAQTVAENAAQRSLAFSLLSQMGLFYQTNFASDFAYAQTSVNLARVAIALERYKLAKGEYPATLTAVAPQFISTIPNDVINGEPLHYRLEPDGLFTVYSVGWNEKDDHGKKTCPSSYYSFYSNTNNTDGSDGDWVWSYSEK